MLRVFAIALLLVLGFAGGWWLRPELNSTTDAESATSDEPQPLYWVAPMDPNYRRDKPGKSPMGMDLVPVYEEESGDEASDGGVTINPRVVNNLGVRTAEAEKGPLTLPIDTVGYVTYDEDRIRHLHSRVAGWIETLKIKAEGEPVSANQTLLEIYSPDLVYAQEEYLLAQRMQDSGMKRAARNKLLALGVTSRQIDELQKRGTTNQRIRIDAPASGYIATLNVREGMYIRPDTEVVSIGSLESVWVIGEVFERQAGQVAKGQAVEIRVPAFPGQVWDGEVDYIYPELDPRTRTLRVRIRVDNPEGKLRPNMFVDLHIDAPLGDDVLSIPREALIRSERHPRVIVAEGGGRFRPAIVTPGAEAGDRVAILGGLEPGERVVTSAQFLIDSETNLDAALARISESQQDTADEKPATVDVGATVTGVMPGHGMISLEHDPIPAWDWPTMKMDFSVSEGVKLQGLEAGQRVTATIRDAGDWEYVVDELRMEEGGAASSSEKETPSGDKTVEATGVVKETMEGMNMLTIRHDPIPAWQWPVMTMTFDVDEGLDTAGLVPGQRVQFTLRETPDGAYRITSIKAQ